MAALLAVACQPQPKEFAPINGDLIYVSADRTVPVARAIQEFSKLYSPPETTSHDAYIHDVKGGGKVVRFQPPLPPAEFANLILWLDAPPDIAGVSNAVGRLLSPADAMSYTLWPDHSAGWGDMLLGVSEDGQHISVYAPEALVSLQDHKQLPPLDLTALEVAADPSLAFEISVESATTSSNPGFAISG